MAFPYGQPDVSIKVSPSFHSLWFSLCLFSPHSQLLQADTQTLSLDLFLFSSFMFHCHIIPEIFITERREGETIFTEVSLLESQYKAIIIFILPRLIPFSVSPALYYAKEYLSPPWVRFPKNPLFSWSQYQSGSRSGGGGVVEWGRGKGNKNHITMQQLQYINYLQIIPLAYILPNKIYTPQMQTVSTCLPL